MSEILTPEAVIQKIAEIASAIGFQAGVSAMETAGALISVLAVHPEKVRPFLAGELSAVDDFDLLCPEKGCLTWLAMNGNLISPAAARAAKQQRDH